VVEGDDMIKLAPPRPVDQRTGRRIGQFTVPMMSAPVPSGYAATASAHASMSSAAPVTADPFTPPARPHARASIAPDQRTPPRAMILIRN
jgi:hypothetical protein